MSLTSRLQTPMDPKKCNPVARKRVAELYQRYSEELLGFIRSMLPISVANAGDLLHHIFIELLRWFDKDPKREVRNPRGLVYEFTRRHLSKHFDKVRRSPSTPAEDEVRTEEFEPSPEAERDDLEQLAGLNQERKAILRAMRRLEDSELQTILYLKFWVGMKEAGISEVMGCSRHTVARRVRKGKDKMFDQIKALETKDPGSTTTTTAILEEWLLELKAMGDDLVVIDSKADEFRTRDDDPAGS